MRTVAADDGSGAVGGEYHKHSNAHAQFMFALAWSPSSLRLCICMASMPVAKLLSTFVHSSAASLASDNEQLFFRQRSCVSVSVCCQSAAVSVLPTKC